MWGYITALGKSFVRPATIFLVFFSGTLMLINATVYYWIESGPNPHVKEFLDALYFTVTTTTGLGLGDIAPVTRMGKIFTMFMTLSGTGLYVSFTAILATSVMEIEIENHSK